MANHITKLRKKSKYKTVASVSKALNISKSMIYQMEGGYKKPSVGLGIEMAKIFDCTLEEIFLPFNTTKSD